MLTGSDNDSVVSMDTSDGSSRDYNDRDWLDTRNINVDMLTPQQIVDEITQDMEWAQLKVAELWFHLEEAYYHLDRMDIMLRAKRDAVHTGNVGKRKHRRMRWEAVKHHLYRRTELANGYEDAYNALVTKIPRLRSIYNMSKDLLLNLEYPECRACNKPFNPCLFLQPRILPDKIYDNIRTMLGPAH